MRRRTAPLVIVVSAMLGVAGLLAVTGVRAADDAVTISDFKYDPASVSVAAGTVVTWTNAATDKHTVTADDGSFDSGEIGGGEAFANLFEAAGTFAYHCTIHPEMTGTIVVTAAAATATGGSPEPTPPAGTLPPGFGSASAPAAASSVPVTPVATAPPDASNSGLSSTYVLILLLVGLAAVIVIAVMIANRRRR